jgi:hypothetical protein
VLFYLNNLHIIPREIYLCRHGQSMYNLTEKLGGDSPLTPLVRVPSPSPWSFIFTRRAAATCGRAFAIRRSEDLFRATHPRRRARRSPASCRSS